MTDVFSVISELLMPLAFILFEDNLQKLCIDQYFGDEVWHFVPLPDLSYLPKFYALYWLSWITVEHHSKCSK